MRLNKRKQQASGSADARCPLRRVDDSSLSASPVCPPATCRSDLTQGVRASARAVASAEQGLRQGAALAGRAVTEHVLPQARGEHWGRGGRELLRKQGRQCR